MAKDSAPDGSSGPRALTGPQFQEALAARQFLLVYQPVIDLQSGAFAGVEALIRWRHPARGILEPHEFMGELVHSDQIRPVGAWALMTACRQGALWHRKGYRFSVSVNVAPQQFSDPDFVADVTDALESSHFNPAMLVLEFSQRTLLDGDRSTASRLVDLGVRISVDDFDLAHSSLEDLAGIPVTTVKLSRSSVSSVVASKRGAAKVHALVELARSRGVQVIASGVEDATQRELLTSERVDQGQGFLFSRPFEVAEIDRYLEDFALFSGKPL